MQNSTTHPATFVMAALICGLLAAVVSVTTAWGAAVDPPKPVSVRLDNSEVVRGFVSAYDEKGFTLTNQDEQQVTVEWQRLTPDRVVKVYTRILEPDDAEGWFDAAVVLYDRPDGRDEAEKALNKATRLDPELSDKAGRLRRGEPLDPPPVAESTEGEATDTEPGHTHGDNGGHGEQGGPIVTGDIQARYWGELSQELMDESVAELKAEAEKAQADIRVKLRLYEDDYFLLYTDLPSNEAKRWAGLLGSMYNKLLDTFGLPRGNNVFRGKCLIFVFQREADYHRYCSVALGFNSQGSAGVCQSRGDGYCVVSFYRQQNTLNFAHVLVHEAVHAFVHRYRSYPHIPSWINEGLAELVAYDLVDSQGYGESDWANQMAYAHRILRQTGSLGGMLDLGHIQGWQYPVAHELARFMIGQSRDRYQNFFHAIKDGKSWEQALEEEYGLTRRQLVKAFGDKIRIRNLTP